MLKQTPNSKGYPCVTLSDGWHRATVPVCKLVKHTFTGPSRGRQIRHLDDNKLNSAHSNLKYGDRAGRQNWRDRKRNRGTKGNERKEIVEIEGELPGSVRLSHPVSDSFGTFGKAANITEIGNSAFKKTGT